MNVILSSFSWCNHASIPDPEDIMAIHQRTGGIDAVVGDGVSEYHSKTRSARRFKFGSHQLTGGQALGQLLKRTLADPPPHSSLAELLIYTNDESRAFAERQGIPLDQPDKLSGIDVAAARVRAETVEIIQMGDCFAIWETKDGSQIATKNQGWLFQRRMDQVQIPYGVHRWDHEGWETAYRQCRLDLTNKPPAEGGLATLNGQHGVENCWYSQTLTRADLRLLLLITDGLAPTQFLYDEAALAPAVISAWRHGDWDAIVEARGGIEKINEGTGIAITFR
jgi:hypothetical protein